MLCDVCRGRGSETKAKEDFRQFPRASESGVRDEGRTHVQQQSNVALQVALTHPHLLQIKINLI